MSEDGAPNLAVELGPLRLKNPVMAASGTFGFGREYADEVEVSELGAVVVKGTTLSPWPGNAPPRIVETAAGMLNSIGLQNDGVEAFVEEKLPWLREHGATVIVNVCGARVEEYARVCEILDEAKGVAGVEINASCPNIAAGGLSFGTRCPDLEELVSACREATRLPMLVKLSPNVTDIVELGLAAADAGADGLSLVNTLRGLAINAETRRPVLGNVVGGLSGPAIKPVALRMVYELRRELEVPIVGMGGIMNAADAVEFLIAGANAVAVGTANFVNPRATLEVIAGIEEYLVRHGLSDVRELVGSLQV
ncbi:MAG: dihydroorotate dehydrogenase [Armatimonadota bacterium]